MEESIKSDSTVNNKFDYLLFKDFEFFGVVEAKRVGVSLSKALVQASLQLFLLRSIEILNDPHLLRRNDSPLIGIISTGESYLFVLLTANRLFVSDIYDATTTDGLKTVIYVIHNLFSGRFPDLQIE
jgi:type I site-specific restriction endonuclease